MAKNSVTYFMGGPKAVRRGGLKVTCLTLQLGQASLVVVELVPQPRSIKFRSDKAEKYYKLSAALSAIT